VFYDIAIGCNEAASETNSFKTPCIRGQGSAYLPSLLHPLPTLTLPMATIAPCCDIIAGDSATINTFCISNINTCSGYLNSNNNNSSWDGCVWSWWYCSSRSYQHQHVVIPTIFVIVTNSFRVIIIIIINAATCSSSISIAITSWCASTPTKYPYNWIVQSIIFNPIHAHTYTCCSTNHGYHSNCC
jgi:hypothetical protein